MRFREWFRTWLGITAAPVVTPPADMRINDDTGLPSPRARLNPWQLPRAPAFVPDAASMAMDGAASSPSMSIASIYSWAVAGAFSEGLGFLGYPYLAELTQRPEYRRISEIYAAEATRKGVKFSGDEKRIDAIEKRMKELKVWSVLREVVEHDGFFGRGQIYIDVGDDASTAQGKAELQKPFSAKAKIKPGGLIGFRTVEAFWSYPGPYESNNPLHPDFYKPQYWYVMANLVDSSRLLTIIGRQMPDILKPSYAFGGLSLSQMSKPYVDNWLRARQSVSDLVHSFSTMVLKTNMGTVLQGKSAANLFKRAALFNDSRDNKGLMLLDKDAEELENVSTPLGTLDKLLAQSQEQIASVTGIPLVILLGVTPSGLNASSDGEVRSFYAMVKAYQERVLRDPLSTMVDLIQLDLDGQIDPKITYDFIDLWEMDEKDKAAIRKSDADMDVAYVGGGIVTNEEVRDRIVQDEDSPYFGIDLSGPAPEPPGEAEAGAAEETDPDNPVAKDAEFEEGKHPRAGNGQFGSGGGGASSSPTRAKVDKAASATAVAKALKKPKTKADHIAHFEAHEAAASAHNAVASLPHYVEDVTGEEKSAAVKAANKHWTAASKARAAARAMPEPEPDAPMVTSSGKPIPHHVVEYIGREGVDKIKAMIADKNSKAADIVAALSPLDVAAKDITPTLAHGQKADAKFYANRIYANPETGDAMNIAQAKTSLIAKAESYAGDGGVKREKLARILLGPPAAGKSTSAERIAKQHGYAIVDGDDAKKVIPEFAGGVGASAVHEESSGIATDVLNVMLARGDNVILPVVGGSPGSIRERIATLEKEGYSVTVDLVDVKEDEAARRMAGRALGTGRHISSSYFMSIGDGPNRTYETLKSEYPGVGFGRIDGNGGQKEETYTDARNHPNASTGTRLFD